MKEKQEKEFVREQIKNKPINRRRAAGKILLSAVCGAVFALAASVVFLLFSSFINSGGAGESQTEESARPSSVDETATPASESESESESETESQSDPESGAQSPPQIAQPPYELTIDEYQKLQYLLYAVGTEGNKSIVTVNTVIRDIDWLDNPYETEGQGAGVIVKDTGAELLILTEYKVIEEAKEISVTFCDDANVPAVLKKCDANTGIAILSVTKNQVPFKTRNEIHVAKRGNSAAVANGSIVLALGSPLGMNYSILTGNITSTNNEISTEDRNYSLLTTDIIASVNGSGVLINKSGELVGIVMQKYGKEDDEITLTAVAFSEVAGVIDMLCEGKDIPYLGLGITTVTDKIAASYDIPKGVYIKEVTMDSPAMRAGLQSGDVITAFNGKAVQTAREYSSALLKLSAGDTVEIRISRKGSSGYNQITCNAEIGILP